MMKLRFNPGWVLVGLLAITTAALAFVMILRFIEPPRLEWKGLAVESASPVMLVVNAETLRRDVSGCSTGVQADLRSGGSVTRLAAPVRTIDGRESRYEIALPTIPEGLHQIQLRETANCDGRPEVNEAPWLSFWVGR